MKKLLIPFLLFSTMLCLYPTSALSLDPLNVGFGKNIMPNGRFAKFEWNDATLIPADRDFDILFKQDNYYLYFGIKFNDVMHVGVDLYIADPSSSMKMLHVSSALGEQYFIEGKWSKPVWGENNLWMVNPVGLLVQNTGEQGILECDGFEFQIDKSMFKNDIWYLFIHLKRPDRIYPQDANPSIIDNWMTIKL